MLHQRAEPAVALTGVEASKAFFAPCLADADGEQLWIAHVDARARCIHLACYDGDERQPDLPVQEILRDAVRFGSAGLVLAQNRKFHGPRPQLTSTQKLASAADALGVTLLDHLFFADRDCTSMRRLGLL